MLTNAAEREVAWVFLARMATLQAIHRNTVRVFNPDRKDPHWGKRKLKLKRDELLSIASARRRSAPQASLGRCQVFPEVVPTA
jgi:hypothetical protein